MMATPILSWLCLLVGAGSGVVQAWAVTSAIEAMLSTVFPRMIEGAVSWYEDPHLQFADQEKQQAAIEMVSHAVAQVATNLAKTASYNPSAASLAYPAGMDMLNGNISYFRVNDSRLETALQAFVKIFSGHVVEGTIAADLDNIPDQLAPVPLVGLVDAFENFAGMMDATLHYTDPVDNIERGLAEIIAEGGGSGGGGIDMDALMETLDRYFLVERDGNIWSISELLIALINSGMFIYK